VLELFQPYYKYCAEQTGCQHYCKEQDRDNQVFKAYLAWCETQRDCNRLRLVDILVRPMQRLTKYSLLLKAVLKKTEDVAVKRDLLDMDRNVETLVRDVNSHMRQRFASFRQAVFSWSVLQAGARTAEDDHSADRFVRADRDKG
jgi:pleckstrin domain-containing family G protein 5